MTIKDKNGKWHHGKKKAKASQTLWQARIQTGREGDELTDSDWEAIAGKKDRLVGRLQQRYGYDKERAEREADEGIAAI